MSCGRPVVIGVVWLVGLIIASVTAASQAAEPVSYRSAFSGERTWVGPDYWTIRWQDWSVIGDQLSVEARPNRSAVLMTHEVSPGDGNVRASVTLHGDAGVSVPIGLWMGVAGPVDDWRSAAAYGDYRAFAGVRPDGTLVLRSRDFQQNATKATTLDLRSPVNLQVVATVVGDRVRIELQAIQNDVSAGRVELELPATSVAGLYGLGTADQLGEPARAGSGAPRWHLRDFRLEATHLAHHPDRTFGPIGWAQYSVNKGVLKLSALMMPVGEQDNRTVQLQLDRGNGFETVAEQVIDPMSRSAHFRVESIDMSRSTPYRVRYEWGGQVHTFDGVVRAEPTDQIKVALMSCDWGYAFPNRPITASIMYRNPDLLVYVGDQIYEFFGKHGAERGPLERSSLDYLRKYALFGWINRDLLRDRPSIIIPDDHDVFQGNLWGAGGRKLPPGGLEMGGYELEAAWVNAIQRTQTWHIPDAVDPTPAEQGISVYFGEFDFGGVSFAVLEDRKWKTGFRSIWSDKDIPRDDIDKLDPSGTQLLGERQERFLARWAAAEPERIHIGISQTMFAKAHTHSGPELKRNTIDMDTNGWPRTPRNRAVSLLGQARAIHLAGDQHVGVLAQLGVNNWTDGPLTFMVPGTANGWPRAWWPEAPGTDRLPGEPEYTGRFLDAFGNQMTILAVANPEPGANKLTAATHTQEQIAHEKGSGFGILTIEPATKRARFDMWRYAFDPAKPEQAEQFPGFPKTFELTDTGWQLLAK